MTTDTSLRDRYLAGEIFAINSIVEDSAKTRYKVVDRGSNYLTLETESGRTVRSWLHDVSEVTDSAPESKDSEFLIVNEQIQMFGYTTKNFDASISEFIVEQFSEFEDSYAKHQIVKLLDSTLQESDLNVAHANLTKVAEFFDKQDMTAPPIVEAVKNEIERKRISEIIAAVANSPIDASNFKTVYDAINKLKGTLHTKAEWSVIAPLFKLAQDYGISGVAAKLPYSLGLTNEDVEFEITMDVFEENIDVLVEDATVDDLEYLDTIDESLSIEARRKLGIEMRKHESRLRPKLERALKTAANSETLQGRARRLAIEILKRRLFKKAPGDMTRQEKERFEAGASRRAALVGRMAQKLIAKVREVQNKRLHSHTLHHGHHQVDVALKNISGAS